MAYTQKHNTKVVILSAYLITVNDMKGNAVKKNNNGLSDEISFVTKKIVSAKNVKPIYNNASSVPEL